MASPAPGDAITRDLASAADLVTRTALRVAPDEKVVIVFDRSSAAAGNALIAATRRAGGLPVAANLDELGESPLEVLPDALVAELASASASVFVARATTDIRLRQHLLHLVARYRLRHAHMPGISSVALSRGLRIDQQQVARAGQRMLDKLARGHFLEAHGPAGTHLRVVMPEEPVWFPQLGVLEPGRWGNLPAGALYSTPALVEGTFVANASIGEYFGAREGLLTSKPVQLFIEAGVVRRVLAPGALALQQDIERMLAFAPNSDRVGLVAIGVNAGIAGPTGEAIVDQNLPGLHICVGDPAAQVTGAAWSARTSFAACQAESTVQVDGAIVVSGGKLLASA